MKSRLIVNPVSGADDAPAHIEIINRHLRQAFGELDISLTIDAGDAKRIAESTARDENYSYIFAAGGDGTLNEVLNGVASVEGGLDQIMFGLIPLGTGNDFANALGLSENVEQTLDILSQKKVFSVDVGQINGCFFVNVSAGGFIAEVSKAVNPQLKSVAGKLAYLIGGAQVFLDYQPTRAEIHLKHLNENIFRAYDVQMFVVCNSRMMGGGRVIAPDAIINDGFFDVFIFKATETLEFINLLGEIFAGVHVENENVEYFRVSSLDLKFDKEISVNTDGEVFLTRQCSYRILPKAAKFLAGSVPFGR